MCTTHFESYLVISILLEQNFLSPYLFLNNGDTPVPTFVRHNMFTSYNGNNGVAILGGSVSGLVSGDLIQLVSYFFLPSLFF